jgi:SEC-C motif domain protein
MTTTRTAAPSVTDAPRDCPCGGAAPGRPSAAKAPRFADCCARFIAGGAAAPTALELMRSRYTAYVLGDAAYLRATWDPATCPADLDVDTKATDAPRWLGLQIKRFDALDDTHAIVEFVARYKVAGRAQRLHEVSRFVRGADARWRYVDGDVSER